MIRLATVSPCYNEEEVLRSSVERLTALFQRMISEGLIAGDSMMVFVNDGSRDRTWQIISELHQENKFVRGINLAHNVGHQNAIMAGMMTAKDWADAVITIDADLQDDIECIPQMVKHFEEGNDIVYGVKVSRKADPLMKRMSAMAFYKMQSSMGVESIYNHADFRLMSRRALQMLSDYGERNLYLRGLIPMIGLPSTTVDDVIGERQAGASKYTLSKMLHLALDGITSFSTRPMQAIFTMGIFFLLIACGIFIYVIHAWVAGTAVPGWSSLILSIWLVGGFILIALGTTGTYIGKIHQLRQKEGTAQFLRFCINGVIAASIHYGIYYLLQLWTDVNIAYTAGYLISFVYNFIATNYFTFHTHPTWKNFVGFAGSHGVNYFLHIVLFNLFLFLGVHRLVAPPLVMGVAMLVQFTILKLVFSRWGKRKEKSLP